MISFIEVMMTRGFKAREVELVSEARAGDMHSTVTKPETIVIAEVMGLRPRHASQSVHLRMHDSDPVCFICGEPATVWHDTKERWLRHPARCVVED